MVLVLSMVLVLTPFSLFVHSLLLAISTPQYYGKETEGSGTAGPSTAGDAGLVLAARMSSPAMTFVARWSPLLGVDPWLA